ncbi:MAG: ATP-dependent Clp protease ATP-binding subunit [Bacilli bacterium]|nr:ATP-dependent Clp protease ATP-binding subunit [Bacilli bacterium]
MFGNFTEETRKILIDAKKEMYELKHPYVGSEHLLLAILKENNNVSNKLKDYDLTYNILKEEIIKVVGIGSSNSKWFLYTPLLKRVIENAILDSKENNQGIVTIEHLFSSLLEEGEGVAIRILLGMDIDIDALYSEFAYKLSNKTSKKNKKLLLEELGVDLTKKALNNELDPVVGRDTEIKRVLEILSRRTKNNPILIGEAGVGKTAIVEELSRMIVSGNVPLQLKNKRIISLDMASTVAGTKYRGEFEDRVKKILKEIEENDDIILFIDEIHTLVGAGGAEGAIDASNIFKPSLARGKLRCIGATTINEYKKFIESDSALERRFQKVLIDIPDKKMTREILANLKEIYEGFHSVIIPDEIIDLIINLSEKYIYDRYNPDKAIDILDEVCASVSLKENKNLKKHHELTQQMKDIILEKNNAIKKRNFALASSMKEKENEIMDKLNKLEIKLFSESKKRIVTKEDVATVINLKANIPVYEILNDESKIMKNLDKNLKSSILGQDKAINEVLNIAKRIKLGLIDNCYSFLFCGPSGVGKTELSKLFGKNIVGESNIIRLDMSEYSEAHSISKIVGAPPGYVGYQDHLNILEEIRNKPYSVLILDEIEKAHPNIINLLFQILENGKIKDSSGRITRFDHVIIIMTSNIGFLENNIGFRGKDNSELKTKLKENFSIPFINRIDNIVIFNSLDQEVIKTLIKNKLDKLKTKYHKKNIKISYNKKIIEQLLKESNYKEFGARKIDKLIKDKVEELIIDSIINKEYNINIKTLSLSLSN